MGTWTVYHKPTSSFNYFKYKNCHPPYTKNNIALPLVKLIVRNVTDSKNYQLQELKDHLLRRKHPEKKINYSLTKLFEPEKHESNDKNVITFTKVYNHNDQFSFKVFTNCTKNTASRELQKAFNVKKCFLLHGNQRQTN